MPLPRNLALLVLLLTTPALVHGQENLQAVAGSRVSCAGGQASGFGCNSVDLMAFVPYGELGGSSFVNDLWGWTDPDTGREYALVAKRDGTAFVDVTDAVNPVLIGTLPRHLGTRSSIWRDVKAYQNHAYIVADGAATAGMQVFDLTQLRSVDAPPVTFSETAHYNSIGNAHNIAINEETGFAYVIGSNTCNAGLHMIDLSTPAEPRFAGCFSHTGTGRVGGGYTHDVQCVIYRGPDADYQGREICFGANETAISIADVTDKANPVAIAAAFYPNVAYAHQGWLTEDQRYFISNDELDELGSSVSQTRTLVWDLEDLDDPLLLTEYQGTTKSIDHNLYIRGNYVFQANYTSGLRILDVSDIHNPVEIAFFDTYTANDGTSFGGAWSNYPFFQSGNIIVSSEGEGLFIVQPLGLALNVSSEAEALPSGVTFAAPYPNPFTAQTTVRLQIEHAQHTTVTVYDLLGRVVVQLFDGLLPAHQPLELTIEGDDLPSGTYLVYARGESFSASQRLVRLR